MSSANINESSGLQFFSTTTGIQSKPLIDFYYDLFNQLGVTDIIHSFELVLERKVVRRFPSIILLNQMHKTTRTVKEKRYSRFTFF